MYVYVPHAYSAGVGVRLYEGNRSPATEVSEGCEPCGFWELNPGPLKNQSVLLGTKPSLQPHVNIFLGWG